MYEPTEKQLSYFKVERFDYHCVLTFDRNAAIKSRFTWKQAFQLAIAKWVAIHEWLLDNPSETTVSNGASETCALCIRDHEGKCRRCPIFKHTRDSTCGSTPYLAYIQAGSREDALEESQNEVKFLQKVYAHFFEVEV